MTTRRAISVLLNVLAVIGPTAALYARYGSDTPITTTSAEYLLPLIFAMLASFLAGTVSARVLDSASESVAALFQGLAKVLQVGAKSQQVKQAT